MIGDSSRTVRREIVFCEWRAKGGGGAFRLKLCEMKLDLVASGDPDNGSRSREWSGVPGVELTAMIETLVWEVVRAVQVGAETVCFAGEM